MKKVTLELGGNDPLVVLKDANIDNAVKGVINGAFLNAGQVCMGVKRIIVDNEIADEFCEKLVLETEKLVMGNPLDDSTTLGTLINEKAAIQVEESVNNVTHDMDLVINETFGPIAPIIRVNGVDDAIKMANDTEYGLQAGVFTENYYSAMKCANEIEAGTVFVNKQSTFRTDNMPFGGFKNSGVGKEGIKYAVEEMTKTKLIGLNLR